MKRFIIIVTALRAGQANDLAAQVDEQGGSETFTQGLSASGNAPATHYWCCWQLKENDGERVQFLLAPLMRRRSVRVFDAEEHTPEQVLDLVNLQRVQTALPIPEDAP